MKKFILIFCAVLFVSAPCLASSVFYEGDGWQCKYDVIQLHSAEYKKLVVVGKNCIIITQYAWEYGKGAYFLVTVGFAIDNKAEEFTFGSGNLIEEGDVDETVTLSDTGTARVEGKFFKIDENIYFRERGTYRKPKAKDKVFLAFTKKLIEITDNLKDGGSLNLTKASRDAVTMYFKNNKFLNHGLRKKSK